MKCAYCLEPMNEGARVCRACGRKQPAPRDVVERRWRTAGLLALAVVAVAPAGYFLWQINERQPAIRGVRDAAAFCAKPGWSPDDAEASVRKMHDSGFDWAGAENVWRCLTGCGYCRE
jgi:hypothetical protein